MVSSSKRTMGGKRASDPTKAIPFKAVKTKMCALAHAIRKKTSAEVVGRRIDYIVGRGGEWSWRTALRSASASRRLAADRAQVGDGAAVGARGGDAKF